MKFGEFSRIFVAGDLPGWTGISLRFYELTEFSALCMLTFKSTTQNTRVKGVVGINFRAGNTPTPNRAIASATEALFSSR